MKNIKRLFFANLLVALLCGTINVSAMTETELRKKFDETVTINGNKYAATAGDKKLADDYLAKYELSSEDCDYIAKKIDEAKAILTAEGQEDLTKLSESTKTKLKKLVSDVAANTSVKATVTSGSVVVLNSDGSTFAEVTKLVKQTGSENSNIAIIAGVSFIITLVGACLVIRQVKNN